MDAGDEGNLFNIADNSGIPELNDDVVVDQDLADHDDEDPDTPRDAGGGSKEPGGERSA